MTTMTTILINGLSWIWRAALKIILVLDTPELELVPVKDIVSIENRVTR